MACAQAPTADVAAGVPVAKRSWVAALASTSMLAVVTMAGADETVKAVVPAVLPRT